MHPENKNEATGDYMVFELLKVTLPKFSLIAFNIFLAW